MNSKWNYVPFDTLFDWKQKSHIKSGDAQKNGQYKMFVCSDTEIKRFDEYIESGESLIFGTGGKASCHFVDEKFAYSTDCVVAQKKKSDICTKFYYYLLRQNRLNSIQQTFTGSGLQHTSKKKIGALLVPVVDIETQKCIVAKIEELFSELDKNVETLKNIKQQLSVYRQAVLRDAFERLDTFVSLQSISERIFDGPFGSNLKTSDYTSSGIRVVRLENLKDGWFDDSKHSFVTQEKYNTISSHTVYPTDLIMATFIADSIKICQMPEYVGFAVNKADCIGIRLKSNYVQRYVMYYLMTKNAYKSLIHEVHGATRPRVNTKQIKGIRIPACDLSAQKQIVENIESRLSVCDSIEKIVDTALQQAEAMRQSILKKAFEGNL